VSAHPGRIVITRQKEQGEPWAIQLRQLGHSVLELPLLRFRSLPVPPEVDTRTFDWILFTSPRAVRTFFDRSLETGTAGLGALGEGTAAALAEAGRTDDLDVRTRDGRELAEAFVAAGHGGAGVLLPGPLRRGPEVEQILTAAGCRVTLLPLYETLPVPAAELPDDPFTAADVVFFCSPSAVRAFCLKWRTRPAVVAIGETTAAATRREGFPTRVAETPDLEAMIRALGPDPETSTTRPENES